MEPKFQTSFIPKKSLVTGNPAINRSSGHASAFFMAFAMIVFVVSLGAAGGGYAWKHILSTYQISYKTQLAERQKQFNIDLIEQLKNANVKIDIAKQLLQNHVAFSGIFDIISRFTIEKVRFTNLSLTMPAAPGADMNISMSGYGNSLSSVAFQSDVLSQLEQYGLRKVVKNPVLSNPALDAAGMVSFGLTASVDASSLQYEKQITGGTSTNAATTSATTATPGH